MKTCKGLSVLVNFLFLLAGAGLLGIGAYSFHAQVSGEKDVFTQFLPWGGLALSVAAMAVGGLVFTLSFFGCCGAAKESRCLLGLYIFFVVILGAGIATSGTMVLTNFGPMIKGLDDVWQNVDPKDQANIQDQFNCCGFLDNTAGPPETANGCQLETPPPPPCGPAIEQTLHHYIQPMAIASAAIGAFMMLSVIVACCLCCAIGKPHVGERQRLLDQARYAQPNTPHHVQHRQQHIYQQ